MDQDARRRGEKWTRGLNKATIAALIVLLAGPALAWGQEVPSLGEPALSNPSSSGGPVKAPPLPGSAHADVLPVPRPVPPGAAGHPLWPIASPAAADVIADGEWPGRRPWTGPGVAQEVPNGGATDCPGGQAASACTTWADIEFLYWWVKHQPLPPNLITTGSAVDPRPGALGQPSTQTIFGPGDISYGALFGGRAEAGCWLGPQQVVGVAGGGFVLESDRFLTTFRAPANGGPLLALTRNDPSTGAAGAFVVAAPSVPGEKVGPFTGSIVFSTRSQFWGADADTVYSLCLSKHLRLFGIAGFRYLDLSEGIAIDTQTTATAVGPVSFEGNNFAVAPVTTVPSLSSSQTTSSNVTTNNVTGITTTTNTTSTTNGASSSTTFVPAAVLTSDRFQTHNQFYGGKIGLRSEWLVDRWFLSVRGTLALGETETVLDVIGSSALKNPVSLATQTAPGGLYALPSNSGRFVFQSFAVVPEVQAKVGVLVTPWLKATVGYDFLYWSRVLRPGDQIGLNIDARQVPTDPSFRAGTATGFPRPMSSYSSFWAQGLTLGLEFAY